MPYQAIVIHSGGLDSSLSLFIAKQAHEKVLSLSFDYKQRAKKELEAAAFIAKSWGIDHQVIQVPYLRDLTSSALLEEGEKLLSEGLGPPPSFVMGRNGLFLRLAAIYLASVSGNFLYTGVIDAESSHYPDCSKRYISLMQEILRLDLLNENFEIRAPLIELTKEETLVLADSLDILFFLLEHSVSCYKGLKKEGCSDCLSCKLRNEAIRSYFSQKFGKLGEAAKAGLDGWLRGLI